MPFLIFILKRRKPVPPYITCHSNDTGKCKRQAHLEDTPDPKSTDWRGCLHDIKVPIGISGKDHITAGSNGHAQKEQVSQGGKSQGYLGMEEIDTDEKYGKDCGGPLEDFRPDDIFPILAVDNDIQCQMEAGKRKRI